MGTTIPVPIWMILVFAALLTVQQWLNAEQAKNMRRLFQWYLDARAREPNEEELSAPPASEDHE